MSVNEEDFKQGMRRFPAGVCVITTKTASGFRAGLTASAVCSLSIDPPSLIVCINQMSGALEPIKESGIFTVNMLAETQVDLSNAFASPVLDEEKFEGAVWTELETGSPVLSDAEVSFDCTLDQCIDVHTHSVLVGKVQAVASSTAETKPLLYLSGAYGGFKPHTG